MINHHPDTRLLNEFASGALPLAQSACVSLHLKYCEQCRRQHQRLEQLGSALFEDLSPQQVDDSLLRTVLSRLDDEPVPLSYARDTDDSDDTLTPNTRAYPSSSATTYPDLAVFKSKPASSLFRWPSTTQQSLDSNEFFRASL